MDQMNTKAEISDKIKLEILSSWKEGHGGDAKNVFLFQGEEGVILLIPKAFYQAELDLHRSATGGGKVLNQYLRTLLHNVASDHISLVEELSGKQIEEVMPLIDLRDGYGIAFYKFSK